MEKQWSETRELSDCGMAYTVRCVVGRGATVSLSLPVGGEQLRCEQVMPPDTPPHTHTPYFDPPGRIPHRSAPVGRSVHREWSMRGSMLNNNVNRGQAGHPMGASIT